MIAGTRLEEALLVASAAHDGQQRKGTTIPYLTHALAVAAIVGEHGGTEDQVIASLLHDVPEDCGGRIRLVEIQARFGLNVARLVEACSDTFENPKPPWRPRKEAYIDHLGHAGPEVLLISAADKVHNLQNILEDLRRDGMACFEKFSGKLEGTLWYYREVSGVMRQRVDTVDAPGLKRLVSLLERLVTEVEGLAAC